MTTEDKQSAPAAPLFLYVQLDAQVTYDFYTHRGRDNKSYALLHRKGSYMVGEHGPIVTETWDKAVRAASLYGADIIAIFHEEKIKFARVMPKGGITWERVIFTPDHNTASTLACSTSPTTKEPDAYGRSQTSLRNKQPSGAQRRKAKRERLAG